MEEKNTKPKKGDEIVITPNKAAFEGSCVGRTEDGFTIFISGCVPGDTVKAVLKKVKKSYAEAKAIEIINPSIYRVDPVCSHFGDCGGCKWQNFAYSSQIEWKRQHVIDSFERIGHLKDIIVKETLSSENEYFYRNKMEFSFGDKRWLTDIEVANDEEILDRNFALGLHAPGRYDRVLDVLNCYLQSEVSNKILNFSKKFFKENSTSIYNTHSHSGILRNLCIRHSVARKETMVIIVTSEEVDDLIYEYSDMLKLNVPEVTTLVQGINRGKAQIAFTNETRVLYGNGIITEKIAGNEFDISPFSFFQTNSLQAEQLYKVAIEAAEIQPEDIVWDLYCGAGTITLAIAAKAKFVLGVEQNEGSIKDADLSAIKNNYLNTKFIASDCRSIINRVDLPKPNIIFTDPPRAGMHTDVVNMIKKIAPEKIIYISCNPTTQARDCELLMDMYLIEYVQPVDMFPQTYHIETVAKLTLLMK